MIGDGSVIEGDKVGGNVDRSQGKILFNDTTVTGHVTNTSNNTIYCDKVELVLEDGSNYSLLVDEKPVELKLERIAHPQEEP